MINYALGYLCNFVALKYIFDSLSLFGLTLGNKERRIFVLISLIPFLMFALVFISYLYDLWRYKELLNFSEDEIDEFESMPREVKTKEVDDE